MSFQCQTPGYALAATRLNPHVTRFLQSKNTGVSEFLKLHNRTAFPDQDTAGQQRIMQFCDSLTRALASADVETMYGEMVSDASGLTPTVQMTSSSEVSTMAMENSEKSSVKMPRSCLLVMQTRLRYHTVHF